MEEKYKLQILNGWVRKVVVCTDCGIIIAEDRGRWVDRALVVGAVRSHVDHPRNKLTTGLRHYLETVDLETRTSRPGLHFAGNDFKH